MEGLHKGCEEEAILLLAVRRELEYDHGPGRVDV
jgi:hypothetical protein